ncbi:hypothetical protein K435DRAFT_772021 [Dendrothele bispora CBS 962.96]|uniref:Uncharacterized protein n=1 Tax=Dendrothele bispora (strain CBS 962.96) TaxID=1314807 RepID=A0A4S8MYS0_DENBC|nr:hypothetical protein K435DRAFT_772021 [Dendrothele bispora CBS 962.96]
MDEVVGYAPLRAAVRPCLNDRNEEIMTTLIRAMGRSRGSFEDGQELLHARVRYEKMLKEFSNNVAVGESQIGRRTVIDLDYLPWIRHMVAADDVLEKETERVGGRTTRNSQRYVRTVELSEGERAILEWTKLPNLENLI